MNSLTPGAAHAAADDPTPRPLRSAQSFRMDEGCYSGEETLGGYENAANGQEARASIRDRGEVKIPAWMTGLNDALREEYAYKLVRTLPTSHIASLVDRLVPILHLDFIEILPSELSLQILSYLPPRSLLNASLASKSWRRFALEPRLWRDLYRAAGWEANDKEVQKFEQEMRDRASEDMRQRSEAKRKAEERREEERKMREFANRNMQRFKVGSAAASANGEGSSGSHRSVGHEGSTAGEWRSTSSGLDANAHSDGVDSMEQSYWSANANSSRRLHLNSEQGPSFSTSTASEDEELYPSPHMTSMVQGFHEPPLTIHPTLTMPGYNCPRLNWAFLYKNRKRLEDNWLHNRYTTFQIPHPTYPHEGHNECIYTIQYSPNWLVSGSRDKTIRIWNLKTRRLRGDPLRGHHGSVLCLQFDESPEEDVIISGSSDSNVIIWRFSTGEIIKVIEKAHQESVLNLRFSKKWLVTCSKDKCIKVWNRQELETTNPDYPWDSKLLFGSNKNNIHHPHHPACRAGHILQDPAMSSGLDLQNPYARCMVNGVQVKVNANTLQPYTPVQVLQGHLAAVNAIQLHGNEIASASGDRLIKVWNLRTGMCEKTFVGHSKGIACIQFDGRTIVSGSSDKTIRVFDKEIQAELATLEGHGALVRTVQASRNRIVSGSYDETVRVWHKDDEGRWAPGAVLRQSTGASPTHQQNGPMDPLTAIMQFQAATAPPVHPPIPVGEVHMHQIHTAGPGLAGAVAAAQLLPNVHHHNNHFNNHHGGNHAAAAGGGGAGNTHRIFKLQFDARWIICCSQDSRIVGWDFAAEEEGVIEASRFFKGDN
ncbi:hypothetical protein RUND412_003316 [Rhizina undulata]